MKKKKTTTDVRYILGSSLNNAIISIANSCNPFIVVRDSICSDRVAYQDVLTIINRYI